MRTFLLSLVATALLWWMLLHVTQYDFAEEGWDLIRVNDSLKEVAQRRVLVDTSTMVSHNRQTLQAAMKALSAHSGTVFMEAQGMERCKENCPVQIRFAYDQDIKSKMLVDVQGNYVRVRVKDEYSVVKDIE